jgi:hypothetical protein
MLRYRQNHFLAFSFFIFQGEGRIFPAGPASSTMTVNAKNKKR